MARGDYREIRGKLGRPRATKRAEDVLKNGATGKGQRKQVCVQLWLRQVEQLEIRASKLGVTVSQYLRLVVDKHLTEKAPERISIL